MLEHGHGVGIGGDEGGAVVVELAEEDLGVGEGAAGCGVGGYGAEGLEGVGFFYDELDAADLVERGYGAAWHDGEVGGEGGYGDEAEVGAGGEKFGGAEGGLSVVEGVALGQFGGMGRVLEVPHERRGVEEVDGGYADAFLVRFLLPQSHPPPPPIKCAKYSK